jgi:hypothetical protein
MAQTPYRPSEGHPMRRFALFSAALLLLVIIGSLPGKGSGLKKSVCVCLPSRAALMLRSMTNMAAIKTTPVAAKQ